MKPVRSAVFAAIFAASVFAAPDAGAQPSLPVTISGNEIKAEIDLPGGLGADVSIRFENVVGLVPGALALSAEIVNPFELLGRLPGLGTTLTSGFPVLLKVVPSPGSALSFSGVYTISIHTHNIHLDSRLPLSFFTAHTSSDDFEDITTFVGMGSYRAGGSGGGFSEFIVLLDLRAIDPVIVGKFARVQATLAEHAGVIAPAALADLQARLAQARTYYDTGLTVSAIAAMATFSEKVVEYSGTSIPDVWRANDDLENVAGYLRSEADTLRFSLTVKAGRR
jgi:hypothetical protein